MVVQALWYTFALATGKLGTERKWFICDATTPQQRLKVQWSVTSEL
jgi:hypothetical protein